MPLKARPASLTGQHQTAFEIDPGAIQLDHLPGREAVKIKDIPQTLERCATGAPAD